MTPREETRTLAPGIIATVCDESKPYAYNNIFNVRLRITVHWERDDAVYQTVLEKLGVCEEEVAAVREELWRGFEGQTAPYLRHPTFPRRLRERQVDEKRKAALKVIHYQ